MMTNMVSMTDMLHPVELSGVSPEVHFTQNGETEKLDPSTKMRKMRFVRG
jgi:hypothetical protein